MTNSSELRAVTGTMFHTFLLPAGNPVAAALVESWKVYHEEAAKDPKGHELGPPFLHMWVALLQALGKSDQVQSPMQC